MNCLIGGCEKPAATLRNGKPRHGGLCHGHAKQKTNGQPFTELRLKNVPPLKRLELAAIDVRDADSADDEAHRRALKRLYMAAMRLRHKLQKPADTHSRG